MTARFQILGSSSAGNCAFLQTEEAKILIDAGFSGRKTTSMLREIGVEPEELDGVFVTHEHNDHAAGVRGLSRFSEIPFFANRDTAECLQGKLERGVQWKIFETGRPFVFRDLEVRPVGVPHDAYDPVCFIFQWGRDDLFSPRQSLAWINDLGHVPPAIHPVLSRAETVVIESNYDEDMLESDVKRPWSLKQRIRGRHGHLSNKDTLAALQQVERPRWRSVHLSHLSRDCNSVSLVEDTFGPFFESLAHEVEMTVVSPG
ncbi:MAG: MBL fold metallo-hydrolase [Verrucomicrobiota bacterium]